MRHLRPSVKNLPWDRLWISQFINHNALTILLINKILKNINMVKVKIKRTGVKYLVPNRAESYQMSSWFLWCKLSLINKMGINPFSAVKGILSNQLQTNLNFSIKRGFWNSLLLKSLHLGTGIEIRTSSKVFKKVKSLELEGILDKNHKVIIWRCLGLI
jgi:hypothetical protein